MATKAPPPHSFDVGSLSLVPGLSKGLDVRIWVVGEMPAVRYRERVMGESQEATDGGESKVPLNTPPSVHVAEGRVLFAPVPRPQPSMSDVSRLSSFFGGRPSDILDFPALDDPVTGSQLGSILEASPS